MFITAADGPHRSPLGLLFGRCILDVGKIGEQECDLSQVFVYKVLETGRPAHLPCRCSGAKLQRGGFLKQPATSRSTASRKYEHCHWQARCLKHGTVLLDRDAWRVLELTLRLSLGRLRRRSVCTIPELAHVLCCPLLHTEPLRKLSKSQLGFLFCKRALMLQDEEAGYEFHWSRRHCETYKYVHRLEGSSCMMALVINFGRSSIRSRCRPAAP